MVTIPLCNDWIVLGLLKSTREFLVLKLAFFREIEGTSCFEKTGHAEDLPIYLENWLGGSMKHFPQKFGSLFLISHPPETNGIKGKLLKNIQVKSENKYLSNYNFLILHNNRIIFWQERRTFSLSLYIWLKI